jgi:hypothetical protein
MTTTTAASIEVAPVEPASEMQPTAAARLVAKLGLVVPAMQRDLGAMWALPDVRSTYLEWLRVMHGVIRATVPLMLAATEECLRRADDPVAEGFAGYLARHIREEYGHDTWVVEDYAAAGGDGTELPGMVVGGAVAALVGSQYYWIRHVHPVALLGHIAVLEGNPPAPSLATDLAARTGLAADAFRSLERHAVLDQRHRADIHRLIDTLPLRPWHETLIGMSALHTAGCVSDVVRAVRNRLNA